MEFTLMAPTLQRATLVKIATNIWKCSSDIDRTISYTDESKYGNHLSTSFWHTIGTSTKSRLRALVLPPILLLQLEEIVTNVGNELLEFLTSLRFRSLVLDNNGFIDCAKLVRCIRHIEWTQHGKIDETKSARNISTDDQLFTRKQRLLIACAFCVKDQVKRFWRESPADFTQNNENFIRGQFFILNFWTTIMDGQEEVSREIKFDMLCYSLTRDNSSALQYLWSIFTDQEKMLCLYCGWHCAFPQPWIFTFNFNLKRIVYFLLRNTDDRMLNTCFRDFGLILLKQLVEDWVYVDLFSIGFKRHCALTSNREFGSLFTCTAKQILNNRHDGGRFRIVFEKLWKNCLLESRIRFIREEGGECAVLLFEAKEFDSLELMLKDLGEEERKNFIIKCISGYKNA